MTNKTPSAIDLVERPRAGDGELTLLSGMLDREIEREGEMHSFMVRAGLLRAIIAEVRASREAADTITRLQAALDEAFDFLGGCDGASEIRGKILAAQRSVGGE